MKFVWKDDLYSSTTEDKYIVKNDYNEVVYEGFVPVIGSESLFYLNRVAEKLMHRGTIDFSSGVTSHPEMSIGLTLYKNEMPVKSEVYVNAYLGEPVRQLTNPINGKLDPRMFFLFSAYNSYPTTVAINEPQPLPPTGFTLELSGKTYFDSKQQSSEITVIQCTDWDGVSITQEGEWFNFSKARTGVIITINENETFSARTGGLHFIYNGEVEESFWFLQTGKTSPSEFVLELSGNTNFNYLPLLHMLYVVECTDWDAVTIGRNDDWFIPTKTDEGVALDVDVNFDDTSRVGELYFYYGGQLIKTVNITQAMYDFFIELSGETNYDYSQQTSNIYVVECTDWNSVGVQQLGSWFSAVKNSTGVTLTINENQGLSERNGSVQFYYNSQIIAQYDIEQSGIVASIELSGATSFGYEQQTSEIYVISSNVPWSDVSVNKDSGNWFSFTKNESGITLNINENTSSSQRDGSLSLSYLGSFVDEILLNQEALIPNIVLSGETSFDSNSGTSNIYLVSSNVPWSSVSISSEGDWFSYSKNSTGVTLTINENQTESSRTGQLDFVYNSTVITGVSISQSAGSAPVELNYFKTVALDSGRITFKTGNSGYSRTMEYRVNNGQWISGRTYTGINVDVSYGDIVEWRSVTTGLPLGDTTSSRQYNYFESTAHINVEGNVLSLIYGDDFSGRTGVDSRLAALFRGNTKLMNAENLILPTTNGSILRYEYMFSGCTSLTKAPALPDTVLGNNYACYQYMFYNCYSLTSAPDLIAPIVPNNAYGDMFYGCSSLNYVKCLAEVFLNENATAYWLEGVSQTGTFVKKSGVSWTTGYRGIPSGWTVQEV